MTLRKHNRPGTYMGKTSAYRIAARTLVATLLKPLENNGVHEGDILDVYFKEHPDGRYDVILSYTPPIKEAA
jgi:hypothetical protein